jgi:hypothetical protein
MLPCPRRASKQEDMKGEWQEIERHRIGKAMSR